MRPSIKCAWFVAFAVAETCKYLATAVPIHARFARRQKKIFKLQSFSAASHFFAKIADICELKLHFSVCVSALYPQHRLYLHFSNFASFIMHDSYLSFGKMSGKVNIPLATRMNGSNFKWMWSGLEALQLIYATNFRDKTCGFWRNSRFIDEITASCFRQSFWISHLFESQKTH